MNVLSLFDGISCGQLALQRAGLKVDKYFASEIDSDCISITQKNFPSTIQIGDVTQVNIKNLPQIDLVIAGSPCQGFSCAGKKLNFSDDRSKLFFEFIRVLNETNSPQFLLENVVMKQEWQDIISEYVGVSPVKLNSALVSAQNRIRLYWTNINFSLPNDLGITEQEILGNNEYFGYMRGRYKNGQLKQVIECRDDGKSPCLTVIPKTVVIPVKCKSVPIEDIKYRYATAEEHESLQTLPVGYTSGHCVSKRRKMISNGWTVDILSHIFKNIKEDARSNAA